MKEPTKTAEEVQAETLRRLNIMTATDTDDAPDAPQQECVICKVADGVSGSVATICADHYGRAVEAAENAENTKQQRSTEVDVEAIKKHVYQLQVYDFRGGQGLNHLINVEAPALIAEIERLRSEQRRK